MKKLLFLCGAAVMIFTSCKRERYYDLTAGKYVTLEKDEKTGRMINTETHKPVYNYVDDEYKIKYGDYKKKVDGDEVKIKDGDTKIKIEDGEKKVKKDD